MIVGAAIIALSLSIPGDTAAQNGEPAWNSPTALALVERGIDRRSDAVVDPALQTYTAQGNGYVYFLIDAPELDQPSLVRTDQVAVEVFWRSPNEGRQRIVGLRERRELPVTRLYYYLDRMTVVQDNYGRSIVIADGDNVNDVPHPVAEGATAVYDYRLAESLTLRLPGVADPVHVQEVQVRPKDSSGPAVIGSVFLEADTGALVRMSFTFTPAAYVDPRLDYIHVTLENGLWQGRFWLPHEQRLEIRRELPEFDLPFGTVIRTRMRIGEYAFNEPLPEFLFASRRPITMAPREERERYPFAQSIDAELRVEGIGRPLEVDEIRREARRAVRDRVLSGLPENRLSVGSVSEIFRYNRAEGVAIGLGVSRRLTDRSAVRLSGGWAFGPGHPTGRIKVSGGDRTLWDVTGFINRTGDVGGSEPVSGATNTIGALLFAEDWTDPYHASGISAGVDHWVRGWSVVGEARLERQRAAELTSDYSLFAPGDGFRPVRRIDEGTLGSVTAGVRREPVEITGGWGSEATLTLGRLDAPESSDFAKAEIGVSPFWTASARRARLDFEAVAGAAVGDLPRQELWLLGGRGTLPGFEFRSMAADRFVRTQMVASADITHPWLRGRLRGGIGWAGLGGPGRESAERWGVGDSGGVRATVGGGIGVFYDLLQIDVARGLGSDGRFELIIEVQPDFWGFL